MVTTLTPAQQSLLLSLIPTTHIGGRSKAPYPWPDIADMINLSCEIVGDIFAPFNSTNIEQEYRIIATRMREENEEKMRRAVYKALVESSRVKGEFPRGLGERMGFVGAGEEGVGEGRG